MQPGDILLLGIQNVCKLCKFLWQMHLLQMLSELPNSSFGTAAVSMGHAATDPFFREPKQSPAHELFAQLHLWIYKHQPYLSGWGMQRQTFPAPSHHPHPLETDPSVQMVGRGTHDREIWACSQLCFLLMQETQRQVAQRRDIKTVFPSHDVGAGVSFQAYKAFAASQ